MSTTPVTLPNIGNPLNWVTEFLGSANVQKLIGLIGGPVLATDFKTWGAKLAAIGAGGGFAVAIHVVDWLRAKVEGPSMAVVPSTVTPAVPVTVQHQVAPS